MLYQQQVHTSLDGPTIEKLNAVARANDKPVGAIVRYAIHLFLTEKVADSHILEIPATLAPRNRRQAHVNQ